jgi:hypothetical protein
MGNFEEKIPDFFKDLVINPSIFIASRFFFRSSYGPMWISQAWMVKLFLRILWFKQLANKTKLKQIRLE